MTVAGLQAIGLDGPEPPFIVAILQGDHGQELTISSRLDDATTPVFLSLRSLPVLRIIVATRGAMTYALPPAKSLTMM